jgi:succinoglycan biosynthesis protein ExoM
MDVSICIASSRPRGLARLLESVDRLKRPDDATLEAIIVENAAEPNGEVTRCCDALASRLRVQRLLEPRRNLSHVRNCAVAAASGRWLAFVDDDEAVHEVWLAAYWSMLGRYDCDGFFGPVLPRLEPADAGWLDGEFFARERFATGTPITAHGARTGNAFLHRSLFDACAFDPAFGVHGGEDWDLFRRMQWRGARFVWCDEAQVDEFVPAHRQRLPWLARRAFHNGASYVRVERRGPSPAIGGLPRLALQALAAWVLMPIAALAGRRSAARAWRRAWVQVGKVWGRLARETGREAI